MVRQREQAGGVVKAELTPDEIRGIRESLGLSQGEAGELIGGGPRAFSKYEAGTIRPTASVANLLRLLEANPAALSALTGRKAAPIGAGGERPFEVTGRHVAELSERKFAMLVRRLLGAEALVSGLPMEGIHVAAKITVSDGGEDARIEWSAGPDRTKYLRNRLSQFQLKAGEVTPGEAANDVLASSGGVKDVVRQVLGAGGAYTMLCGHSYVKKQIIKREERIRSALRGAGLAIQDDQVAFWDADQIAEWTNAHPSVATWLLEQTQPGLIGPFRTWSHWAGRSEHSNSPWVADSRLAGIQRRLRELVARPQGIARVLGFSGVGKSRLVLEALGPTDEEDGGPSLSDLVLYAVETEADPVAIKSVVQNLADAAARAVVVVDSCAPDTHQDLAAIAKGSGSRLSLVTIDDEMPLDPALKDVVVVEEAEAAAVQAMLEHIAPGLPNDDLRRLLKFARGFPKVAVLLGQSWIEERPVAYATDDYLVDNVILGRRPSNPDLLRSAAAILSAFSILGAKPPVDGDLEQVAQLSRNLTADDLRAAIEDLARKGIVQRRGRLIAVQPRPIALTLAERQWRQWGPKRWDEVLTGPLSKALKIRAARQLALLDTTDIASEVARHLCRPGGPLATVEGLAEPGRAEVLSYLAEIDTAVVANMLEDALADSNLAEVAGDLRRHLVWALEKIAFVSDTFEQGARLLLRLAVAENEHWGNNATGQFKGLFPVLLGDTEAGAEARLRVLDEALESNDPRQLQIAAECLLEGAKTNYFSRAVGAEIQGSRPALKPWSPATYGELWGYIEECLDRLVTLAIRPDDIGLEAREELGHRLRSYVGAGMVDRVERIVAAVTAAHGHYWPEALSSLGDVLAHDRAKLDPEVEQRVRRLIDALQPKDLADRVRLIVTDMPWDFPCDEKLDFESRGERQRAAVEDLVRDLLAEPGALEGFLPRLCVGRHRMSAAFGEALAEEAADPLHWRDPIMRAMEAAPADERNFELLAGYLAGVARVAPDAVEAFKEQAAHSPVFASALPLVCWRLDIKESDIPLVRGAFDAGLLRAGALMQWTLGGVLAKLPPGAVVPLFDRLLGGDAEAYSVGLDIMGMYAHGRAERLEELRPQLRQVASAAGRLPRTRGSQMYAHHFKELMEWILDKGRDDADARAIALTLTRELIRAVDDDAENLIEPLLPKLLSGFPEIVWPLLGQAIARDRRTSWRFEHVLGKTFSFRNREDPAILHLPQDTLFAWCHAQPDVGPAFVAVVAPILTTREPNVPDRTLHPLMRRLLDEFGNREDVLRGVARNLHTFGWTGSRTTYYARYEQPLSELTAHPIGTVRRWAKKMLSQLGSVIEAAHHEDEEREAQWEV